jgi:hypothetical protein
MPDRSPPHRRQLLERSAVILNPYRFASAGPSYPSYIRDDADAIDALTGIYISGGWSSTGGGYATGYRYKAAGSGSAYVRFSFTGLDAGTYDVAATWVQFTNRATNTPHRVLNGFSLLSTVAVNQELAPTADFTEGGRPFKSLGQFTITGDALRVEITDAANEYVIADAIRIQRVS